MCAERAARLEWDGSSRPRKPFWLIRAFVAAAYSVVAVAVLTC